MDRRISWRLSWLAMFVAVVALHGCTPAPTPLAGAERDAVLAYSEPLGDNLLAGFNAGDYAQFSRDFDDAMLKAIPASGLESTRTQVVGKIGQYVSREVTSVTPQGTYLVVIYNAKFEQEDNVTVTITYGSAEPHKISGLWFTSPKLAGK
jgi:hypothetical protein